MPEVLIAIVFLVVAALSGVWLEPVPWPSLIDEDMLHAMDALLPAFQAMADAANQTADAFTGFAAVMQSALDEAVASLSPAEREEFARRCNGGEYAFDILATLSARE